MHKCIYGWILDCMGGYMDAWIHGCIDECMDAWIDAWINGQMTQRQKDRGRERDAWIDNLRMKFPATDG